jgi:hypothetical protein
LATALGFGGPVFWRFARELTATFAVSCKPCLAASLSCDMQNIAHTFLTQLATDSSNELLVAIIGLPSILDVVLVSRG